MPQSATVGVLLDHAQAKIALSDENEGFTYVNAASEGIPGVTPEQLVGENAFDRIHQDDAEKARRTFRDVTQRKQYTRKHRRVSASGPRRSWVWTESRATMADSGSRR